MSKDKSLLEKIKWNGEIYPHFIRTGNFEEDLKYMIWTCSSQEEYERNVISIIACDYLKPKSIHKDLTLNKEEIDFLLRKLSYDQARLSQALNTLIRMRIDNVYGIAGQE